MKNKKITSLLVAGALTVGIVGGTLAWLTASDTVTNSFKTASNVDNVIAVEVYEKFDEVSGSHVYPNALINKDVQIQNKADKAGKGVNEFIRVKAPTVSPKLEGSSVNLLNVTTTGETGKWMEQDGYYYYIGIVTPGKFTAQLVDSVKFPATLTKETDYQVDIKADAIQAGQDAIFGAVTADVATTGWGLDPNSGVGKVLKGIQDAQTTADKELVPELTETK